MADGKANWLKDLFFPIVLLLCGAIVGVLGDQYKLRVSTPRLRHGESVTHTQEASGRFRQTVTSAFYPVGLPAIQHLEAHATASPQAQIIDEGIADEPSDQPPDIRQIENGAIPKLMRTLEVNNFHKPQRVRWSITAESQTPSEQPIVWFNFKGLNDIENENALRWIERLPLSGIVLGLLIYAVIATVAAIYFRFQRRSDDIQV